MNPHTRMKTIFNLLFSMSYDAEYSTHMHEWKLICRLFFLPEKISSARASHLHRLFPRGIIIRKRKIPLRKPSSSLWDSKFLCKKKLFLFLFREAENSHHDFPSSFVCSIFHFWAPSMVLQRHANDKRGREIWEEEKLNFNCNARREATVEVSIFSKHKSPP